MKTSIKGIKKAIGEFNRINYNNYARFFYDAFYNEVYMIEYVDFASVPALLDANTIQVCHIARRDGKLTMVELRNLIKEALSEDIKRIEMLLRIEEMHNNK